MTKRSLNDGVLSEWVNQETGEIRYVREIDIKTTDKDFDKVWIALMMSALDIIGNKKIEILSYLVNSRNRSDNVIFATQDAISEATGVSKKTVNTTIAELKKAKLISQVCPGAYRLSPGIIWRGSHFARMAVMAKFSEETVSKTPEKAKADATPTPPTPTPSEAAEPRFCEEVVDRETGELCGGRLHPEVQEDGVWWFCERCRTGVKDSGSGCEYSQPSKPAA